MTANLKGKISSFAVDYSTGKQMLTLALDLDFRPYIDEFKDKDLSVEVKRYYPKRSLSANAFLWATLGDIAERLRITPDEVYRELIPDVGGNSVIVPIKASAVDEWIRNWEVKGKGWVCEKLG